MFIWKFGVGCVFLIFTTFLMGEACEVNGVGYSEIICIFSVCGLVGGSSGVMFKLNLTCVIRGECFRDSNGSPIWMSIWTERPE